MGKIFGNNDIVLFQGDSVTDCNRDRSDGGSLGYGYPAAVKEIYNTVFPSSITTFINKGVSGDRVRDLIARYEKDIFDVQPTFISIFIGINDVWRAFDSNDPCSLERFREEYTYLVKKIRAELPSAKLMLIEPFALHSLPDRKEWRTDLDPKRAFARQLAGEYANYFLPMQKIFDDKIKKGEFSPQELAGDGVHPSAAGQSQRYRHACSPPRYKYRSTAQAAHGQHNALVKQNRAYTSV